MSEDRIFTEGRSLAQIKERERESQETVSYARRIRMHVINNYNL